VFYEQPLATRFGTSLIQEIIDTAWDDVDMAVAWVRRSGTSHINGAVRQFLARGGKMRVTVGVDIENTSVEGLEDLLGWESAGDIRTHVHHNEATSTFHPKVYLFSNARHARLIVGSNNLTEAGLYINSEAGLSVDGPRSDTVFVSVRTALQGWRDESTGLAKSLDQSLLDELQRRHYVYPESHLRARRRDASKLRSGAAIFASRPYAAPRPRAAVGPVPPNRRGAVLLMRVRRASESARRTQVQFPKSVLATQFFDGTRAIVSSQDGRSHELHEAFARGIVNTIKVEIPEIKQMVDPVMRMERTDQGTVYEAYDSGSALGRPIREALERGFALVPPRTEASISDRDRATWWQFI
jgi:HKD family nuclease